MSNENENYGMFQDYFHYTGKYRSEAATRSTCNLRHKTPK